jgi:hypothetical protein
VPFTLPGSKDLCNTQKEFNTPEEVPDFIQALEYEDLQNPGTVAHVQLRLGGSLVPPQRVTLGAWPNPVLNQLRVPDQRLLSNRTGWEVPVLSLKLLDDSAVVVYWPTWNLKPGESREMGFTYGLGGVASQESGGKLGLTVGGALVAGADFTVTAYVSRPIPGQRLTLSVPPGLRLVHDDAVQNVPPVQDIFGGSHNSIVSWKVRADRSGNYLLVVESSTGLRQNLRVEIKGPMVD